MSERFVDRVIRNISGSPEVFLGSNCNAILNFWSFFGDLSDRQRDVANERRESSSRDKFAIYSSLSNKVWVKSPEFRVFIDHHSCSPFNRGYYNSLFKGATLELFLMDELIEDGYDFFYIKLFENL